MLKEQSHGHSIRLLLFLLWHNFKPVVHFVLLFTLLAAHHRRHYQNGHHHQLNHDLLQANYKDSANTKCSPSFSHIESPWIEQSNTECELHFNFFSKFNIFLIVIISIIIILLSSSTQSSSSRSPWIEQSNTKCELNFNFFSECRVIIINIAVIRHETSSQNESYQNLKRVE